MQKITTKILLLYSNLLSVFIECFLHSANVPDPDCRYSRNPAYADVRVTCKCVPTTSLTTTDLDSELSFTCTLQDSESVGVFVSSKVGWLIIHKQNFVRGR